MGMTWPMVAILVVFAVVLLLLRLLSRVIARFVVSRLESSPAAKALVTVIARVATAALALLLMGCGAYVLATGNVDLSLSNRPSHVAFNGWGAFAVGIFLVSCGGFLFPFGWAGPMFNDWSPALKLVLGCASIGVAGSVMAIVIYYAAHA
jgi:hypothetical protein